MATQSFYDPTDSLQQPIERVPPHSLEAEEAVLGGLLVDSDALNEVIEILKPDDFYRPRHQTIYKAVIELFEMSEPVDIITVSEQLSDQESLENAGGRSYIMSLAEMHLTSVNVAYYAKIIRNKSQLRALIQAGSQIIESSFQESQSVDALDKAQSLILEIAQNTMAEDFSHIKDILATSYEQIEDRFENKDKLMGVSTGFYDLDTMTSGLQKSDMIVIAARPSMGKTAFCLNIASHVALREKRPVLFFSLEMSKEQLVTRMLCSEGELDAQKIRTGQLTEQDFAKISNAMGMLGDAPLYIDDTPGMTVMEVRSKARKLKMEVGEVGLVVIDYLQLMEGPGGSGGFENRVQIISQISRGLKSIAREIDAPVVALSQLSRAVESRENKKPMLSDLRESGAIEQDADLVAFIYRDEYYNKDSERPGTADIIIAKQRNGPVGEVSLLFRHNITRFLNPATQANNIF